MGTSDSSADSSANTSGQRPPPSFRAESRAWAALRQPIQQIVSITALLLGLTLVGMVGLRLTTNGSWFDCLYMAVITLTTVGYGEPMPLGTSGRAFIIAYLAMSIGVFTFSAFTLGSILVSARLHEIWRWRRMQKAIQHVSDHYIICGGGRMGIIICEFLEQRGQPFVLVDSDAEQVAGLCETRGWLSVVGDATDDQTLLAAGIDRAQALAAVLPTDSANVYVVLSARILRSDILIIARAGDPKAGQKLERAGASRVVSPYTSGAVKMARFMLTPTVEDFLEVAGAKGAGLELADIQMTPDSPYVGKRLADTDLRDRGVMVIRIQRADGELLMPPSGTTQIRAGDSLLAFGRMDDVNHTIEESTADSPVTG